jgi:ATP-dependent protease ClpP protease subunit
MLKLVPLLLALSFSTFASTDIVLTDDNTVSFNQPVKGDYVAKKQLEIIVKSSKLSYGKALYLVLNTPGGSVTDGLLLVDTIKSLNRSVHTITIFAASMGYQFAQELGTRYILPSGTLMSHRGALSGLSGQVPGELNSRLGHIEEILNGMNVRAAKRVGVSVESYKQSIINELWTSGQEAVNSGHADAVANVTCAKDLYKGSTKEEFNSMFGSAVIEYSNCPLITSPISIESDRISVGKEIDNMKKRVTLNF